MPGGCVCQPEEGRLRVNKTRSLPLKGFTLVEKQPTSTVWSVQVGTQCWGPGAITGAPQWGDA